MAFNDFDSSHLDGWQEAEKVLYEELESGEDTEISLRPGYDDAPNQHDLQRLLKPEAQRFQESESEAVQDLYEFVDDYFAETQYVDWTFVEDGFEDLQQREAEAFSYGDGTDLVVEVYEPGEDGHDVLRL
ncbi:hypothetical protein SAMN05443574_103296 [Haloarcula vallismortis]|uniref:Uncharacterized protein n=2 Tax=Haloarcula vallismortis TaxID=28442 RepID=M0JR12_HALVA|nr:hypothetical protein [Haloarcula vallismortis]EMA11562.1 hypothetical protein C437_01580 [Haloarcula vallismortis ATCC 29715]SDW44949.1 hypothetical protein SAMN05443574_103296 [Haloarcula vallismortis]